jgi:hypothetical protein
MGALTKEAIELLIDRAANWPDAAQAELIRLMDELEQKHVGAYRLTEVERADPKLLFKKSSAAKLRRMRRSPRCSINIGNEGQF